MNLYLKLKIWMGKNPGTVNSSKRFVAYLVDWFVGALFMTFPLCMIWMSQKHDLEAMSEINLWMIQDGISTQMALVCALLAFACAIFYYVIIPWKFYPGQTLGKRMMGFKIVKMDGSKLGLGTLIIREVLGIMILEGAFYNISGLLRDALSILTHLNFTGILMYVGLAFSIVSAALCMLTASHRMIHDYLAKTSVDLCTNNK